jgi:16S rRNA processing protein RimM
MYIVGYVLKPHGIRGEIKINPVSPRPDRFKYLKKIYIRKETVRSYSIQHLRISNNFVFLKLHQINSRTEAEELRNCEILIDEKQLIELETDEYFIHDLIDCTVQTEDGRYLGTLTDIWQNSSNDVYVVTDKRGRELLLPAIKDVIKSIEIENKKIVVHILDGLFD